MINPKSFIISLNFYNTKELGRITHGEHYEDMEVYYGSFKSNNITPLPAGGVSDN